MDLVVCIGKVFEPRTRDFCFKAASFHFGRIGSKRSCDERAEFEIVSRENSMKIAPYVHADLNIKADLLLGRDLNQNWIIDGRRNRIVYVSKLKDENLLI